MHEGSSYHYAAAFANIKKRDRGMLCKPGTLVGLTIDELRKRAKTSELDLPKKDENEVHKRAKIHWPEYTRKYLPHIEPDWVEQPVIKEVTLKGTSFKLAGVLDLTTKKAAKNELSEAVIDYKTTGRAKGQADADESLQLSIYSFASGRNKVGLLSFVKSANPYIAYVKSERTPADHAWALEIARRVYLSIQTGVFTLANPDPRNWWCTEKFCGYWDDCRGKYVKTKTQRLV